MSKFFIILFFMGITIQLHAASLNRSAEPVVHSQVTLPTPQNLSQNFFGQWVIGWGTGAEGARQRLENIQREDIDIIKQKGTTLEIVNLWQGYYEREAQNNLNNPTARYRAKLMKKIAEFW